nr:Kinetochore-associated protein 1 [Polyrhizophydium stewartii]
MAGRRLELVAHAHIEAPRPPPDGPPGTGAAAVHHGRAEHVTAARAGALLCVAAGSELHIIASDKRLAGQVELDCPIEALAVHPALPLAVVGDSLGSIHLVHLPLSEVFYSQMVVPQALLSAAASHGRIFACVTFAASGSSTELVVASTVGSLLRLSNIDFELVNAMVSEGDTEDAAAEIRDQVKVEAVSLLPASTEQLRHLHITHDLIYACASALQSSRSVCEFAVVQQALETTSIRVVELVVASALQSARTLIAAGRLDEAEELAVANQIDIQSMYKMRIEALMHELDDTPVLPQIMGDIEAIMTRIKLIKEALATGESARALNLWRRHATDPALRDNIPSILAEIGEGTSIQDTLLLVHELEEYIPTVEQRHKDIVEQFRLMQLKVMMLHYGIASFNIGNMGLAKRLLRHILSQRDKRHALEDALQVVKAYHHLRKMDVYVMRAQILLTGRLLDRCRLLLATGSEMREQDPAPPYTFEPAPGSDAASEIQAQLTRAERTMLCQQLLVWVVLQIKHGIANGNETLFVSMVEAGKTLCSIIGEFSIQSTHLPPAVVFQRLARLHNDFGQMVHPDTLMDPELVDCSPGAATAQTLAVCCRIALESGFMLAFESNNSNVLKLSGSLLHLARLALQHSDRDDLPRHLDLFKDLELLHHILMHSDMGEYRASLSKRRRLSAGRSRTNSDDYVSAGGSSSAGQSSAGALSRALGGYAAASADSAGEADNSDADETQARFGASVFREHYREAGLVFNTRVVLEHTVGFVLSAIAMGETLAREIHDPFGSSEPVSANKGKRASHKAPGRELAHHHGRQLFDACMHHRHFQLALRVSQRLLELARSPLSDNALGSHEAVELANEYTRLSESAMQHLATQMLSAKTIDKHYALACLLNLPTKTAFEAFKARYQASANGEYQRDLVPKLLYKTGGDLEMVLEFTTYYHIEDDHVYFEFAKQQLFSRSPARQSDQDSAPRHHVRIAGILADIDNKNRYLEILATECLPRISPYNYEDIRFVNEQILSIDPNQRSAKTAVLALDLLKTYRRTVQPTHAELAAAFKAFSEKPPTGYEETDTLKKACEHSDKRLPFHMLLSDPWAVLAAEISEESLPKLVPICYILGLSADTLHLRLVDSKIKTLQKELAHGSHEAVATRGIKSSDFRSLLSKIKDNEKAVSTSVLVGGVFPCGVDRIALYRLALQLAERWLSSSKSDLAQADTAAKAETTIVRLKKMIVQEAERVLQNEILFVFERNPQQGAQLLLRFAYQPSNKIETWARVRALTVLLRLSRLSELPSKELSEEDVWQYMRMMMYLKEFQELNIVQSLQEFMHCDKAAFVRSLWLSHRNDAKGLRLICKLSIDYNVLDGELLHSVLVRLVEKGELHFVIESLEILARCAMVSILGWMPYVWAHALTDAGMFESLDDKELFWMLDLMHDGDGLNDSADPAVDAGVLAVAGRLLSDCAMAQINHRQIFSTIAASPHVDAFVKYFAWHDLEVVAEVSRAEHEGGDESGDARVRMLRAYVAKHGLGAAGEAAVERAAAALGSAAGGEGRADARGGDAE